MHGRPIGVRLGLLAVLAALLLPLPETGRVLHALQDLAHVPLGAGLALALRAGWDRRGVRPRRRSAAMAFVMTVVLLGLVEGGQGLAGRDPSLRDLLAGAGGGLVALSWRAALARGAPEAIVGLAVGLAALAVAAGPAAGELYDAWRLRRDFPELASFEDDLELTRWVLADAEGVRAPEDATDGLFALNVVLHPAPYPALTLRWPYPDWRGYEALAFDLCVQDGAALVLVLKVVDAGHDETYEDRYQARLELGPGPSRIRIPLAEVENGPAARRLDLGRIRSLQLFANGLDAPRRIALDHVRLEAARP